VRPRQKVEIIMATLAPTDSDGNKVMRTWRRVEEDLGRQCDPVEFRAGGVVWATTPTPYAAALRLHTGRGLTARAWAISTWAWRALQIPMMFDNYAELDYVRGRMAPKLEKRIEDKGYLCSIGATPAGFSSSLTKPVHRLDDLRKLKLFTWAGYPTEEDLWRPTAFAWCAASTDIVQQPRDPRHRSRGPPPP